MSKLTDYAENKLADFVRGQPLVLPPWWRIRPLSVASDSAQTIIIGSGVDRFLATRDLATWSGTQGPGTTLASSGSSHAVSNNVALNMGTATAPVGTVAHIGFFDATTGGNCWIWADLPTPIDTAAGVPVVIPAGDLTLTLGVAGGMTNYLSNKMLDLLLRGVDYGWPSSTWLKAMTSAPNNAGGGVEVGGGVGYGRYELPSSMPFWSGTQGPGTTVASSGSGGRISNNIQLAFADPTGPWGTIGWAAIDDDPAGGNPLFWRALLAPKTIGAGMPLRFEPDALGLTFA